MRLVKTFCQANHALLLRPTPYCLLHSPCCRICMYGGEAARQTPSSLPVSHIFSSPFIYVLMCVGGGSGGGGGVPSNAAFTRRTAHMHFVPLPTLLTTSRLRPAIQLARPDCKLVETAGPVVRYRNNCTTTGPFGHSFWGHCEVKLRRRRAAHPNVGHGAARDCKWDQ